MHFVNRSVKDWAENFTAATSSVDYHTDEMISKTIASEFAKQTLLVIAHRYVEINPNLRTPAHGLAAFEPSLALIVCWCCKKARSWSSTALQLFLTMRLRLSTACARQLASESSKSSRRWQKAEKASQESCLAGRLSEGCRLACWKEARMTLGITLPDHTKTIRSSLA